MRLHINFSLSSLIADSTDFVEISSSNNPLVRFTSDPSTHRQCFNVSIIDDEIIEDTESFALNLTLAGGSTNAVVIAPHISVVEITDEDSEHHIIPLLSE